MSVLPGVAKTVTPHNTNDLATPGQIYVGVSGDVAIIAENCTDTVILKSHPIGYIPCRVRRVLVTGTTATDMVVFSS